MVMTTKGRLWSSGLSHHVVPDSAGFLLGLLFDPEDRGDVYLKNLGFLQTTWCYNSDDGAQHKN
jgi:hypothetical protein